MPGIFAQIAAGFIPSWKVAENEHYYAFLDIHPLRKGHTLVIPRKETDYIFDLPEAEYQGLMEFSRLIALAIKAAIPCQRVGVAVIGLEVPHAHVHLIPINSMADMDFGRPKLKLADEEMQTTAAAISAAFLKFSGLS